MLTKPSRLDRDIAKHERRVSAKEAKSKQNKAEAEAWIKVATLVKARDGYHCRVCGVHVTPFGVGDPRRWTHVHHIVYRSAGGGSYPRNLLTLCGICHDDEHQHRISITGTADALKVERR